MDVREKLIELVKNALRAYGRDLEKVVEPYDFIADFLIHSGVTVQEWISVKDKLPEKDEVVIICTDKNFVYAGDLMGDVWFLDNDSWTETVTHWMPLPKPPKGAYK